ncbi:MAG: hypothetical protein FWD61_17615 [Phycisphaerales bacterium]|nr:hypothetical protein [Phycisphaerales bacterium]
MTGITFGISVSLAALLLMAATACTQSPPSSFGSNNVGIVSNINITSDKVPDVTSLEAWSKHFIKPGMTDKEKALAVWKSVVAYQHQNPYPVEYLHSPGNAVVDPIKMFNVYGTGLCSIHAAHVAALARAAGLQARNWSITRHNVAEVYFDGAWHMLDASLVNYFPKPDGSIASVEEIIAAVHDFYQTHPNLKNNPEGLDQFRKDGKWKTEGPPLLAHCPFYHDDGLFDATWPWQCGWMESMTEYNAPKAFVYEDGYSMGYRVNVQLRQGEKLTRNWSNKGVYLNMDIPLNAVGRGPGQPPPCMNQTTGEGPMTYLKNVEGGTLPPGRIGNGTIEYNVPLANGAFRGGALLAENLNDNAHIKDPAKPATLVIRMPSSYVYLGGELNLDAVIANAGNIKILFSENNGLDFREVQTLAASGKTTIDLKPFIHRRYDYQLKFILTGAGTGLNALNIREDIQHSQAPLPALAQGENTMTFSAGNEGTITLEGSTKADNKGKQVLATDFHPTSENIGTPMLSVKGKTGWIEFPIATPAPMHRLRIFSFYRVMTEGDLWNVTVSFDGGKTYKDVGQLAPPNKFMGQQFTLSDIPANTTSALIRFTGTQKEVALLFNLRLDADYAEPNGGFRPVKITYTWEENGKEKQDTHIANSPNDTWKINCETKPLLKSYTLELVP